MRKHKRGLLRHAMSAASDIKQAPQPLESGTYLVNASEVTSGKRIAPKQIADQVTLIVYGWHNVEPGTLSWVFPSYDAAMSAAGAMRNAVRWAIVAGKRWTTLDEARAHNAVLAEQD